MLDNKVVNLAFDLKTKLFKGTLAIPSKPDLEIEVLAAAAAAQPGINVTWGFHGTVGGFEDRLLPCPDFPWVFSNLNFPVPGADCGGAITVEVDLP